MTRQLIICSALIASVTAPALAVTVSSAAVHRFTIPATAPRATDVAGQFRARSTAAPWFSFPASPPIVTMPIEFPHATNAAAVFSVKRADDLNAYSAARQAVGDRAGLDARKVIKRRMPAPGHLISIQLHIGDTTWVTGGIDNQ
jgi:hypothetical protein